MQRLSRIGRNTLAVSVSTLLLSACNQGDDAPKPAAVAPQPAAPSMAALSIPLCLNGQCAVIDQDAKLLVPFDNDYDNIVASAYQGTLMAAREERWNLIQAKDGKVLRDDIGEALSLLTPNLYGFVRDGKYGVVDGQGKEVQAPRFDDIYPNSANEFIIYEIDGKRGILDAKGKQLTEALYDTTLVNGSVAEHGGLISAERGEEKWIINFATGEQKAVAYESLGDLHDGVMTAGIIGEGYQLVDAKGDAVGDGKRYDYLGTPANGLVAFREKYDSPCGYLDYQGKVAIAAQFAGCGAFGKQGGMAQQRVEDGSSGKYGLIDRSGAWKVQPQYDSADSAGLTALGYTVDVPGLAAVGVSTGLFSADFGIFNLDEGSEWVKPGYAQIGALGNDLFVVAKKGGPQKTVSFMGSESQVPVVGLMDRSGKMLLEPGELISIQSAYDGRFLEGLDGMDNAAHTVLLDRQGRTLVPALWQKLEVNPQQGYILGYEVSGTGDEATETLRALYDLNGKPRFTVATTDCGAEQLLDGNGKAIWPQDPTPYCQSDDEQDDEGEPEQEPAPAEESEETSES
ncbi:TPA: WG repeat-containing protein [Pseudomonas aeruginosa]|nr:WG repeat-containing protein [Pseudomonas aeruginosa]